MQRLGSLCFAFLVAASWALLADEARSRDMTISPVSPNSYLEAQEDSADALVAAAPASVPAGKAEAAADKPVPPRPKLEKPSPEESTPPREYALPPPDMLASLAGDRLAEAPNMYGDSYFGAHTGLVFVAIPNSDDALTRGIAAVPLPSADRVGKISENGNTMPHDRVFFLYNHFNNALGVDVTGLPGGPVQRSFDVDRYTLGLEKTFLDRWWSVELRMPLFGRTELETSDFGFANDHVGNLAVIVKRLIHRSENTAACIGLSIDTPTGSDLSARANGLDLRFHNDAVHLMPYLGLLRTPNDRVFYQAFLQVDVPTVGNRLDYSGPVSGSFGRYNDQTLLYADLEAGYWLYRSERNRGLTGLASVLELHYISTLQDADLLTSPFGVQLTNTANRMDVVDLTVGLHAELGHNTICRVAGVVPLTTASNRVFDGELQVQLERRF